MAFQSDGSGLFAAAHYTTAGGSLLPGLIRQASVAVNASGNYLVSATTAAGASPVSYGTRRHFGLAVVQETGGTQRYVLGWRGGNGPRSFFWASRASTVSAFNTPTEGVLQAVNSVDVGALGTGLLSSGYAGVINQ